MDNTLKCRMWREKQRTDPEKRRQQQEYERNKYLKRKAQGKIKTTKHLKKKEAKEELRQQWRTAKQLHRLKLNAHTSATESDVIVVEPDIAVLTEMGMPAMIEIDTEHHSTVSEYHLNLGEDSVPQDSEAYLEQTDQASFTVESTDHVDQLTVNLETTRKSTRKSKPSEVVRNFWGTRRGKRSTLHVEVETTTKSMSQTNLEAGGEILTLNIQDTSDEYSSIITENADAPDGHQSLNYVNILASEVYLEPTDKDYFNFESTDHVDLLSTVNLEHHSPVSENQVERIEDSSVTDRYNLTVESIDPSTINLEAQTTRKSARKRKLSEGVRTFLETRGGKRPKQKSGQIMGKNKINQNGNVSKEKRVPLAQTSLSHNTPQKKCWRINARLKKENTNLKRNAKKQRVALDRLRQKYQNLLSKCADSVEQEVNKIIGKENVSNEIRKHLEQKVVLEQQLLSTNGRITSHKDRDVMRRVLLHGDLPKEKKKIMYVKKFTPKRTVLNTNPNNNTATLAHREINKTPQIPSLREDIENFLQEEGNSRMTTGTSETVTRHGKKKQKMYLMKDLTELHDDFLKTVTYPVSYSTFCKYRPFWVLHPDCNSRETTACKKHENVSLILRRLHIEKVLKSESKRALIEDITCNPLEEDCMLRKCDGCKDKKPEWQKYAGEKKVIYHQFEVIKETYEEVRKLPNGETKKTTKVVSREVKKEKQATLEEVVQHLQELIPAFLKHTYYMYHQFDRMREKRVSLGAKEFYLWVDFAENWTTKMARETQGIHFGASRQQFTLHTAMGYSGTEKLSYCTLSENRTHGPPEIMAHMKPVISDLLKKTGESHDSEEIQIHFQSDGPVTQYRGKDMFALMIESFPHLFPTVSSFTWNFSESGHGRGAVDGVGSDVKRHADKLVSFGTDVDTFEKFLKCSNDLKNIKIYEVTEEDIQQIQLTPRKAKTFNGSMSVHQTTWSRSNPRELFFNYLSCFQCPPGTKCQHYFLGTLTYKGDEIDEMNDGEADEPDQSAETQQPKQMSLNLEAVDAGTSEIKLRKNDWVAITLSGHAYPGKITRIRGPKATVSVMLKDQEWYSWPNPPDMRTKEKNMLVKLNCPPEEVSPERFKFSMIGNKFNSQELKINEKEIVPNF